MRKWNRMLTVAVMGLALAAAGFSAVAAEKVGIVTSIGGLGDKSFNDFTFAGAQQAAREMGVDIDIVEPLAIGDFEGLLRETVSYTHLTLPTN